MADDHEKSPELQLLEGIAEGVTRVEQKLDAASRKAVVAGGVAGAVTGAIAGTIAPELIRAGIDLAKAKLGM